MTLKDKKDKIKKYTPHVDKAKKVAPYALAAVGGLLVVKSAWDFMQGDTESVKNYVFNLKNPPAEVWINNPFRQECLKITPEFGTDFYADKIINSFEQTALSAKEAIAAAGLFGLSLISRRYASKQAKK